MEELIANALYLIAEQSPMLAILGWAVWRLEARVTACIEHTQDLLETLLDKWVHPP